MNMYARALNRIRRVTNIGRVYHIHIEDISNNAKVFHVVQDSGSILCPRRLGYYKTYDDARNAIYREVMYRRATKD